MTDWKETRTTLHGLRVGLDLIMPDGFFNKTIEGICVLIHGLELYCRTREDADESPSGVEWLSDGDHPAVVPYRECKPGGTCDKCGTVMAQHGRIDYEGGGHVVCPGNWIYKRKYDEYYPQADEPTKEV